MCIDNFVILNITLLLYLNLQFYFIILILILLLLYFSPRKCSLGKWVNYWINNSILRGLLLAIVMPKF